MKVIAFVLLLISSSAGHAGPLDQLLQEVLEQQRSGQQADAARQARFLADQSQQQKLLAEAKAAQSRAEAESKALRDEFTAQEKRLAELQLQLKQASGELESLFATVKGFAGTIESELKTSLTAAQFPGRADSLKELATGREIPTVPQMETLWLRVLEEMTASAQVVKFPGKINAAGGGLRTAEIIRIGPFTALADGKYLRYLPTTGQLEELPQQPDGALLKLARDFGETRNPFASLAIDPTRGAVLDQIAASGGGSSFLPKSLRGLVSNGIDIAIIGTLFLASIWAVAAAFERFWYYRRVDLRAYPSRIALETDLTRNLNVIGTVAANAPFVGLLGTVLGIMVTFQKMGAERSMDVHTIMVGLSTALKATAVGLLVAIPCVILNNVLRRRIRELVSAYEVQRGS